jgi:hypothetical protein
MMSVMVWLMLGFELLRQLCILSNPTDIQMYMHLALRIECRLRVIESGVLSRWIDIRDRCMCWYVCQIELIRSYTLLRRWIPLIRLLSLLGHGVRVMMIWLYKVVTIFSLWEGLVPFVTWVYTHLNSIANDLRCVWAWILLMHVGLLN